MNKFFILLFFIALFSCQQSKKEAAAIPSNPTEATSSSSVPPVHASKVEMNKERSGLPAIPENLMKKMLKEVDYIDYIFYNLSISVSQDTKQDINASIMFITPTKVDSVPASCKPIGRTFFNAKGNEVMSADIYYSEQCTFYIFIKDEKPVYSSIYTNDGFKFYTTLIQQGNKK